MVKSHSKDREQEVLLIWMDFTSLVDINVNEDCTSMISSTLTWIASAGQEFKRLEIVLLKGLIIQLCCTMDQSMCSQGMMVALDITISGSAHSKVRNISGSRLMQKERNLLIDLATLLLSAQIPCSSLVVGMATTLWMTSISIVFLPNFGSRSEG